MAERVNGILKDELVLGNYTSFSTALEHVTRIIKVYNKERPHLSLGDPVWTISPQHRLIRKVVLSKNTGHRGAEKI